MDEPALRDVERWKDKIEVRLDNRQVFFLFFGSARVACMLFVLGVIVGKRLESRGRAEAPVIEDPLAALDRFGIPPQPAVTPAPLTFPHALLGNNTTAAKSGRLERAAGRSTLTTAFPTTAAPATSAVPSAESAKRTALLPRPMTAAAGGGVAVASSTKAPATTPRAPSPQGPGVAIAPKATSALAAKTPAPPVARAPAPPARSDKTRANFLLQLSSFQDRAEADAFARRFSAQSAYVVASEVPGKGLWYRVRVGSYGNLKDATVAKSTFEREHGVIAYVAGTGPAQ
jgi:hypothetical protein